MNFLRGILRATVCALISLWLAMGQFLCLASAHLTESALNQAEPVKVDVLTFTDESGAGASTELSEFFARILAKELFALSNGGLAARFFSLRDNMGNPVSTKEWDIKRIVVHGRKVRAQFVIRPGLLAPSTENSGGRRDAKFKLYADVVSVENAALDRVEVESAGNKKQRDSDSSTQLDLTGLRVDEFTSSPSYPAFLNSIQRLAGSVYKMVRSGPSEKSLPDEKAVEVQTPPPGLGEGKDSVTPPEDLQSGTVDEELRQLITQAQECLNSAQATSEKINALITALENLRAALEKKTSALETGDFAGVERADQEVETQRQALEQSEAEIIPAESANQESPQSEPMPSQSKWDTWFDRITKAADFAFGFIDKIQDARARWRDFTSGASGQSGDTAPTEESFENVDGAVLREENDRQTGVIDSPANRPAVVVMERAAVKNALFSPAIAGTLPTISARRAPVADAEVSEPTSGAVTRTDRNGLYTLRVPAGRRKLIVKLAGRKVAEVSVDVMRGRGAAADIAIKPGASGVQSARILPSRAIINQAGSQTGAVNGVVLDGGGSPLPRALIEWQNNPVARTDSQGRFALNRIPAGAQRLTIRATGLKPKDKEINVRPNTVSEAEIRIDSRGKTPSPTGGILVPGAGAALRIAVSDEQNRPVEGAKVQVIGAASSISARTDVTGRREFRDLKPGSYKVSVYRFGLAEQSQGVSLRGSGNEVRFRLERTHSRLEEAAPKALSELQIQAQDPKQKPIPGATVEIRSKSGVFSAERGRTNAGGEAVFKLLPGRYDVKVSQGGFQESSRSIQVEARGFNRETFELRASGVPGDISLPIARGELRIIVRDAKTGRPIPEATVSIRGQTFRTDRSGIYNVNLPVSSYRVTIAKTGYERVERPVGIGAGDRKSLEFDLKPDSRSLPPEPEPGNSRTSSARLTGRVTDERTGRPIPGATISIQTGQSDTTDRDGNYRIETVRPGAHRVNITRGGYRSDSKTVDIKADRDKQQDFKLKPDDKGLPEPAPIPGPSPREVGILMGRVTDDKTGRPISGVTVSLGANGDVTNPSGAYEIRNLRPGRYSVSVGRSGYESINKNVEVKAEGARRQDFELKPRGDSKVNQPERSGRQSAPFPTSSELTGLVVDAKNGRPIQGALVSVQGRSDTTDRSGSYRITNLRPGSQDIRVSSPGYQSGSERVTIGADRSVRMNFKLSPAIPVFRR